MTNSECIVRSPKCRRKCCPECNEHLVDLISPDGAGGSRRTGGPSFPVAHHHKEHLGRRQNTGGNYLHLCSITLWSWTRDAQWEGLHRLLHGLLVEASDVQPHGWSRRARLHPNIFLCSYKRRRTATMGLISLPHDL